MLLILILILILGLGAEVGLVAFEWGSTAGGFDHCLSHLPAKGDSLGSGPRVRGKPAAPGAARGKPVGEAGRETNRELHPSPGPGDAHDKTRCRSCAASILVASSA
jgi:hypothetical protein